ncbi:hypothetical protein JCM24511_04846 [Saitozyma sp. JCM 24511]|nr:hypothetical protein JCM24511_04846 [Saitozyma sp. JCM 24511]
MTTSRDFADAALVSATTLRFKDQNKAPDTRFRIIRRYLDLDYTRHESLSSPASDVLETPPASQISSSASLFSVMDPKSYPKPPVARPPSVATNPISSGSRSHQVSAGHGHFKDVSAESRVQQDGPSPQQSGGGIERAPLSSEEDVPHTISVIHDDMQGLSIGGSFRSPDAPLHPPNGHHLLLEQLDLIWSGDWWDVFRAQLSDESTGKSFSVIMKLMVPADMDVDPFEDGAEDPNAHWIFSRRMGHAYLAAYNEDNAYNTILRLYQGTLVPRYYGLFTAHVNPKHKLNGDFPPDILIMLLEDVGPSIVRNPRVALFKFLRPEEKSAIMQVYAELHAKNIHHGSIKLGHILRRPGGSIALISFEDAGHLPKSQGSVCTMEMNELERRMNPGKM